MSVGSALCCVVDVWTCECVDVCALNVSEACLVLSVNVAFPIQHTCEPQYARVATATNYHEHPNSHHELHTPTTRHAAYKHVFASTLHSHTLHTHPFYRLDQKSKVNRRRVQSA
jgi:hypothetical protein